MTKNMPVVPETPNRSSTTEETMMVSIVMPEIGLRAVVAIAFAATDVKKNANSRVSPRPTRTATSDWPRVEKKAPAARVESTTPTRIVTIGMSRSVRSVACASPWRNVRRAIENDPAMIRSDFRMPKMPAVAIAPTPM